MSMHVFEKVLAGTALVAVLAFSPVAKAQPMHMETGVTAHAGTMLLAADKAPAADEKMKKEKKEKKPKKDKEKKEKKPKKDKKPAAEGAVKSN